MDAFAKWAPEGFFSWISARKQHPAMARLEENKAHAREVATKLVEEKREGLKDGSRKDILSLLGSSTPLCDPSIHATTSDAPVKANSAMRPDWRLNDEEVIAQVRYGGTCYCPSF